MERRNELKTKARELEYGNRPEEALALYLQLLDRAEQPSPAMWAHAGDLQLRLGKTDSAGQSLDKAIEGFAAAGQLNNAIALAYRLADAQVGGPDVHLRLGKLALEQGYRRIARDSIGAFARATVSAGRADEAVEPIASFLRRFPDERELWRDWVEELLAMGREDDAVDGLRRLSDLLAGGGAEAAATAIGAEIARLRPEPGAAPAHAPPTAPEGLGRDDTDEDLPLLGNLPEFAAPRTVEDSPIAPLAGLQSTQADWGVTDSSEESIAEPLPLLGTAPEVDPEVDEEEIAADAAIGPAAPSFDRQAAVTELARLSTRKVEAAEDPSTHYDLGVAFKEMGLVDESIAHLSAALERGHDPIATLEVLGEILVSRGRYELAATLLQGLTAGSGTSPELLGIEYWLARSAEELGKVDNARHHYQQILAVDSSFRDTSVRLSRLSTPF